MKFSIISAAAFIAAVSAAPAEVTTRELSNIVVPVDVLPVTAPVDNDAAPFTTQALNEKRGLKSKRATLVVDVYLDLNGSGRHEGLWTDTQRCYNLGNGWPDEITSLSVPNGFGCIFYRDKNCNNNDYRLTVPGGNFIGDLRVYNFDDIISSYLCYQ
ncbi:hypothetical protein GQ44DRAFT_784119 [Phaeosphaeriaceae sp. PMI808]|nr:hypothetical protein GQ44DRAFT_784119 [Phaeosphaeriaceae sp. PMI808]